jgi:hypothetical protein
MLGTEQIAMRWWRLSWGFRVSSSTYHRKQAQILAGLALSAGDAIKADQFKLAAMEQLERAQIVEEAEANSPHAPDPKKT